MGKALEIYFHNLPTVIQMVFVAILVITTLLIVASLRKDKNENSSELNAETLEKTFKKVLESTSSHRAEFLKEKLDTAETGAGDGASALSTAARAVDVVAKATHGAGATPADMGRSEELAKTLEEKEKLIQSLQQGMEELKKVKEQTALAASAGAAGEDNSAAVKAAETKIKELENKLGEYGVLEQDIADLSLYKDQNAKLKQEIAMLKGEAPPPVESTAVAAPPPPSGPTELTQQLDQISQEITQAATVATSAPPVAPPVPSEKEDLEKLMSEAAKMEPAAPVVAAQPPPPAPSPESVPPAPAAAAAPAAVVEPEPAKEPSKEAVQQAAETAAAEDPNAGEKLIQEFESFIKEQKP